MVKSLFLLHNVISLGDIMGNKIKNKFKRLMKMKQFLIYHSAERDTSWKKRAKLASVLNMAEDLTLPGLAPSPNSTSYRLRTQLDLMNMLQGSRLSLSLNLGSVSWWITYNLPV